jgi:hypothetical protein
MLHKIIQFLFNTWCIQLTFWRSIIQMKTWEQQEANTQSYKIFGT